MDHVRLVTAVTLGVLLVAGGCRSDEGHGEEPAPEITESPEEPEHAEAKVQVPESAPEKAMAALESGLAPAAVSLVQAQIDLMRAEDGRIWRVEGTPLRVIVLDYPSAERAAKGVVKVVRWANRSGLVHHAEATTNGPRVVVVGPLTTDSPTPEIRGMVDRYLDAFLGAR
ncbi:MAG: hypothetical protein ACQEXJ_02045 [Myxococcota bacterium]